MTDIAEEIGEWVVASRRSNYNFLYIIFYAYIAIAALLGAPPRLPTPPNMIYTLVNKNTGARRTITLPGNHKREDLVAAVARLH